MAAIRGRSALHPQPFDLAAVAREVADGADDAGAVVTFTGRVRHDDQVVALEFETYPEMADAELGRIRDALVAAHAPRGLLGLTLLHRSGRLEVGEEVVLVAAAARHRAIAFQVAAEAMEVLKHQAPIWKREARADGSVRWVPGAHERADGPEAAVTESDLVRPKQ